MKFLKYILIALLVVGINANYVFGANTHSIDLESGSSQYLSHADSASIPTSGDFTVEMHIKPESSPSNQEYVLVSHHDGSAGNRNFQFRYIDIGGTKYLFLQEGTSDNGVSITSLGTGTWKKVGVVFDDTANSAEFFVDCSSVGTAGSLTSTRDNSTQDLRIGAVNSSPANFFDGLIDDVTFYSDKRTSTEITDNCSIETTDTGNGVGYWKMNNDLTDTFGVIGTLTNNNSATFSTDVPFGAVAVVREEEYIIYDE